MMMMVMMVMMIVIGDDDDGDDDSLVSDGPGLELVAAAGARRAGSRELPRPRPLIFAREYIQCLREASTVTRRVKIAIRVFRLRIPSLGSILKFEEKIILSSCLKLNLTRARHHAIVLVLVQLYDSKMRQRVCIIHDMHM